MLDLRLPIGWFFLINAGLLVISGIVDPHNVVFQGQRLNLNICWGLVMFSFGAFMAALAYGEKFRVRRDVPELAVAEAVDPEQN